MFLALQRAPITILAVTSPFVIALSSLAQAPAAETAQAAVPAPPAEPLPPTPAATAHAQPPAEPAEPKPRAWYEAIKIRGYAQFRYNGLPTFDENDDLGNDQGDKYIGQGSGFGIRRARLVISGDVHEHVSVYLQTDFASAIGDQNHVALMRDWYADVYLDAAKEFRIRLGQSKVPFGFENLQSSQNRLPFDRNDALNSAVKDERDLGAFVYWAPEATRKLLKQLVDDNLKGSGDYGVIGAGIYNGQTANRFDRNDNFHVVGRASYPFEVGSQVIEIGGGAYTGLYEIKLEAQGDGTEYRTTDPDQNLRDARVYGSLILYPKPFGMQLEYNAGVGPQQGEDDPTVIKGRQLHGGYALLSFKIDEPLGTVSLIPYVRGTLYEGGKKFETNAPRYEVRELESGIEWQIIKPLEMTLAYTVTDRTSSKHPYAQHDGHLLRIQAQVNY